MKQPSHNRTTLSQERGGRSGPARMALIAAVLLTFGPVSLMGSARANPTPPVPEPTTEPTTEPMPPQPDRDIDPALYILWLLEMIRRGLL